MKSKILKYFFIIILFLSSVFQLNSELRKIYFNLYSNSPYLKNFTVEIRKLLLDPYDQDYCDLGIIDKYKVRDKIIFSTFLEDSNIYYINVKPYNIFEIFIPKYLDTLNMDLLIDDKKGTVVLELKHLDSLNLLFRKFKNWEQDKLYFKKYYDTLNFQDYERINRTIFYNNDEVNVFLSHDIYNINDYNSLQIDYYLNLLKYFGKKAFKIDSSILIENTEIIDEFIKRSKINEFNKVNFVLLINRLIDFKILLYCSKEMTHIEKFRLKNEYIKKYPYELQSLLYYNHFTYSTAMYYKEDYFQEKMNDIHFIITGMENNTNYSRELVNCLSFIFDSTRKVKKYFDFSIPIDSSGNNIPQNIFQNKVILVIFWTSWCPHCKEIMEFSKDVIEKFKNRDFSVINISLDGSINKWKTAMQKYPIGNHFISIGSDANQYSKDYFINGVPRCFLIDRNGKIINDYLPLPLDSSLSNQIEKLISQ